MGEGSLTPGIASIEAVTASGRGDTYCSWRTSRRLVTACSAVHGSAIRLPWTVLATPLETQPDSPPPSPRTTDEQSRTLCHRRNPLPSFSSLCSSLSAVPFPFPFPSLLHRSSEIEQLVLRLLQRLIPGAAETLTGRLRHPPTFCWSRRAASSRGPALPCPVLLLVRRSLLAHPNAHSAASSAGQESPRTSTQRTSSRSYTLTHSLSFAFMPDVQAACTTKISTASGAPSGSLPPRSATNESKSKAANCEARRRRESQPRLDSTRLNLP